MEVTYPEGSREFSREVLFACSLHSGAKLKLADPETDRPASNSTVALNGPMIAYTYSVIGVDTGETEIVTADVANGNTILTVPNVAGFTDACIVEFRELDDLVVTHHGSAAWSLRKGRGCKTQTFQVYDASPADGPDLLEEGLSLDPRSLRSLKRSVSWENDGRRRFARLR